MGRVRAASDRQADLVFKAAELMCELSPVLRDATDRYRWEIRPKGPPGAGRGPAGNRALELNGSEIGAVTPRLEREARNHGTLRERRFAT